MQPVEQFLSKLLLQRAPFRVGRQAKSGINLEKGLSVVARFVHMSNRHQTSDKPAQIRAESRVQSRALASPDDRFVVSSVDVMCQCEEQKIEKRLRVHR